METIRDRQGHILGYLDHTALSNAIVARDRQGHIVAVYDVPSNTTRLPNGHTVVWVVWSRTTPATTSPACCAAARGRSAS